MDSPVVEVGIVVDDDGDSLPDGFGCEHYRRKCQFITPCCKKLYTCRFCHDDKEDHKLNRNEVTQIQCLKCSTAQDVSPKCCNCQTTFGNYFCEICRLYDDEDKQQFHCSSCGICRVGGRGNFFHCAKCDMCFAKRMENNHICIENVSRANCTVCLEDLHTSRLPTSIPPCGHLIHRHCFLDLLGSGNYACPLCSKSMVNMSSVWTSMDTEIEMTPMPTEYADKKVWILCRDCLRKSEVKFHILGLKCQHCRAYNTCQIPTPEPVKEEVAVGETACKSK